jgi:hypothetical protein
MFYVFKPALTFYGKEYSCLIKYLGTIVYMFVPSGIVLRVSRTLKSVLVLFIYI